MDSPHELEDLRRDREARIAQLESRLQKPRPLGVRPPLAIAAIVGAVALLWMERLELGYLVAPAEPVVLGSEGAYDFSLLRSNRYAKLHGIPTLRATYFDGGAKLVVGLKDTPVLVVRGTLPGEEWKGGAAPPQPDQRPFAVGGRLLSQDDAPRTYQDAFPLHLGFGEVRPRDGKLWILVEGERPRESAGVYLYTGLLVLLILANGYLLVRRLLGGGAERATR